MKSIVIYTTSVVTAACESGEMARSRALRLRAAVVPGVRIPQRKHAAGNQHIFMIPAGAAGAGASGPSSRGCPV